MIETALPATLERKLTALDRHLRRQRLLRGLGLLGLVLAPLAGLALLADAFYALPSWARYGFLGGWLLVGLWTAWRVLLGPLLHRPARADLAAVIEQRHPNLGERLSTTVELAGKGDTGCGSPRLIALLAADAERRTADIDFIQAVPPRAGGPFVALAVVAALVVLSPALRWPREFGIHVQRFLTPWRAVDWPAPYQLVVSPGDAHAALGRPWSVQARLTPHRSGVALPTECQVEVIDAGGQVFHQLLALESGGFTGRIDRVAGDFTYRVVAGQAVSPVYQVTAVEPVELAPGSPRIVVSPPAYALKNLEPRSLQAVQDFSGMQLGTAQLRFEFRRPALAAVLRWTAADVRHARELPVALAADGQSAEASLPLTEAGSLQLILTGPHGIVTETPACRVNVQPDQPPAFLQVTGGEDRKSIHPYDRLALMVRIVDDVAVDEAAVEYRINNGASMVEPIALQGQGTPEARGEFDFALAGKLREGDELRYRVRAADNRRVPSAGLQPQVVWHPAGDRWRTVTVARRGPSAVQEITARRDDFQQKLDRIKAALGADRKALARLEEESRNQTSLSPEQAKVLQDLERDSRKQATALGELAREAEKSPGLEALADLAREVADGELRRSERAFQEAGQQAHVPDRQKRLAVAEQELAGALRRLDELRQLNQQVAQALLEQQQLQTLADRQQQLAEATNQQSAADLLRKEQAELNQELQRLMQQSDRLRESMNQARQDEARQLGQQAQELAQGQRDLLEARRQQGNAGQALPAGQNPVAALVREQNELAKLTTELARQLAKDQGQKAPAALQGEEAARTAQQAARRLQAGAFGPAEEAGRQSAQQLRQLEKAQPEHAAQAAKLAERQEAVNRQLEALAKNPDVQRTQQQARQQELQRQTDELAKRLAQLAGQASTPEAQKALQQASTEAQKAQQAMRQAEKQGMDGKMELSQQTQALAADALERTAEQTARANPPRQADAPQAEAGMALQQAQRDMNQAQEQLQQNNSPAARPAMHSAAQQLNRAAEQLTRQTGQSGGDATNSERGASSQGAPEAGAFAQALKKHNAKHWGELPGELRTQLLQDMRAKYGDDYARIIKLYFEQLADRK
ncbi:MAG: hypothetical protein JNM56_19145 [Planctomycetia bacterium]|nr:hypothetical protein [Planctomycetia bacterium]